MFNTAPTTSSLNQSNSPVNPFTFSASSPGLLTKMPSYVSSFTPGSSFNSVYTSSAYLNMDNPTSGSVKSGVGYELGSTGSFTPLFTFTVGANVPSTFTVGLFFNNGLGEWSQAQIVGGGGTGTGTRTVYGNIDALFFTITGATSGTVFTVQGIASSTAPGANSNLDIMGITFDSVPEPSTLGATALAALALIWFGRRKKGLFTHDRS